MTQSTSAVLGGPSQTGRRKRTDLMPTLPVHRAEGERSPRPYGLHLSSASSSRGSVTRSTGMSVSMSRLDQLSRPRGRQTPSPLKPLHENGPQSSSAGPTPIPRTRSRNAVHGSPPSASSTPTGRTSMKSKSMSHLAPGPSKNASGGSTPTPPPFVPRMTRAERLRQKARLAGLAAQTERASPTQRPNGWF